MYVQRSLDPILHKALGRGKSILLLGPRQTGKTTLLSHISADLNISFAKTSLRQKYEREVGLFAQEIEALPRKTTPEIPLVVVDEVQKIPAVLDDAQDLIDRRIARFIFTGSSSRKLRRDHANLLPGRLIALRMDPLIFEEYSQGTLEERLLDGTLPAMVTLTPQDRETELESYVTMYLEEEIRAEAVVRQVGTFGRFLELAAAESGLIVNFRKLSQVVGVSHTTLMSYYQILEDCLIVERIEPFSESKTRKKLTRSEKYLFFDLGVRRVAAREGRRLPAASFGHLFEQAVGLEILRHLRLKHPRATLHFWSDPSGPEVDWVIRDEGALYPIETKWTDTPRLSDAKHLITFLKEYPAAQKAYIVCRATRRAQLTPRIVALPWQEIGTLLS